MSFNNNPKSLINLSNYEEYFLLYVDEELNAEEKKAVEGFVIAHPHLQEELDLLCSTRLPMADLKLENKSELFSGNMKMNTLDESLLLYIDNELPPAERLRMEQQIQSNPDYQLQYRLLLQTKAAPSTLVFPDKASLYRRTERRIIPVWLRVAAAVVLLAGSGAILFNGNEEIAGPVALTPIAVQQEPKENAMPPVAAPGQSPADREQLTAAPSIEKTSKAKPANEPGNAVAAITTLKTEAPKRTNNLPAPEAKEKELIAVHTPKELPQTTQQIINDPVVTTTDAGTYHTQKATSTDPVYTSISEPASQEKGGSLKGLLRKATRFIERRTGVAATNENDELLIGAVAIKLK